MYDQVAVPARPPPLPPVSQVDASIHTRQSRTYEPKDPDLRHKRVRDFRLNELQQFSREYRDLHRALLRTLPETVFDPSFLTDVRTLVSDLTEMDVDLWLHSVRVLRRTELRAIVPGSACICILGLAPLTEKVLLEIDLRFVYRAVDRLLGGHGVSVDLHRPLTEIEQGVLSYLLLKVLSIFAQQFEHPEQVAVRLEDIRNDLKSCADIVRHEDDWLCASWKMNYDLEVGYVRAFLPTGLARRIVPEHPPAGSRLAERRKSLVRRRMNRLAGSLVDCGIKIGHIDLNPDEIGALDPGDIILLDECTVSQLDATGIAGQARLTIGRGECGAVHGDLGLGGATGQEIVFQVSHIETFEQPQEHDPHEVHGEPENPEQLIAEYEAPSEDFGEGDDGTSRADDEQEEDYGIDDEDAGEEEYEYEEAEEGYEEGAYEEEGGYEEEGYAEEGGGEEAGYEAEGEDGFEIDDEDNLDETGGLLGDVPIQVVVELGRVQLTADEVIRLRAGHLMELGRSPADPVDLVVNGKLLAKGELVEIEGTLGVKILSLGREPDA